MKYGHWEYPGILNPADWVGFVYRIRDLDTNKEYIGKKFFFKIKKKTVKGRKNKKHVKADSDWKIYTGSSKELNAEISLRGKDRFEFFIESLHESRGTLAYTEVQKQVFEDVLRAKLPDGTKKYYNGMIAPIKFIPHDETENEKKAKI